MLWSKKKLSPAAAPGASPAGSAQVSRGGPLAAATSSEPPAPGAADKALDVLLTLVRLYGKHAFDTENAEASEVAAACDAWATRLSLGTPRDVAEGSKKGSGAGAARDWPGLLAFMRDQRQSESEYVRRSLGNFREAILCFSACLTKTLGEERASDGLIERRLDLLSRAVEANDTALIRSEAKQVVDLVRTSTAQRRKREAEQVWEIGERLREVRQELAEARKRAELDPLTQLSNRAAFDTHLQHLASFGELLGEAPWLLMCDLDNFKTINDTYGHPAGDEVLRQVSHALSRTFLRKQDFVCRYGGEEFAALLLDTTPAQMKLLADRLMSAVRSLHITHGSHHIHVTLSLGLARLDHGDTPSSWLERADAALYRAKDSGRDRYEFAP
jgi:diguanylate cyclase (GGDEF)-like protein